MRTYFSYRSLRATVLALGVAGAAADAAEQSGYLDEPIYDTATHDEALVNVGVAVNTWPDCTTLESAIADIFRVEGLADKPDQEKALALWKWFRVLVSATGGNYAYEGPRGDEQLCHDPHKIFTVYGHHQCDGQSWAMAGLWRAAGYVAFDECTYGHTTAALRYRDADGQFRYHSFDPQRRYYHWDATHQRVATWSLPVMRGMVYRHLTAPRHLHSLRTSLRVGETIVRAWDNNGHVVPSGRDKQQAAQNRYYAHAPGKTSGIYAAAGEEVQTFEAPMDAARFAAALFPGSCNVVSSRLDDGRTILHPKSAGETAELIYRLAPPYVVADARVRAVLRKKAIEDVCRLLVSRDGQQWQIAYELGRTGEHQVDVDLGPGARRAGRPDVFTAYDVRIKVQLKTGGEPEQVGVSGLRLCAHRMLNKRTLPNMRPGENVWRVTADRLAPGYALELGVDYDVDGNPGSVTHRVTQFPYYFRVDLPAVAETVYENYDQRFNDGPVRMAAIRMRLVPADESPMSGVDVLPPSQGEAAFGRAFPHPAKMVNPHTQDRTETDIRQTNGFFPQSDRRLRDPKAMAELIEKMRHGPGEERWIATEDLGNYPEALDALLAELPRADGDQTLFLCKALAQIGDPRAIDPLLKRWKRAPRGAPGTRYIPDVLAAIGDRRVVPDLIAPLERCRFDYRFHIAHALGVLGGPEAEKALRDLAARDPLHAIREEARRALRVESQDRRAVAPDPSGRTLAGHNERSGGPFWMEGAKSDLLVSDGEFLYMQRIKFDRSLGRMETPQITSLGDLDMGGRHLLATGTFLDDSGFDRLFWMHGNRWPGFYFAQHAPKAGQIIAFDDQTTYTVKYFYRRHGLSPGFVPAEAGYLLFADDADNEPILLVTRLVARRRP